MTKSSVNMTDPGLFATSSKCPQTVTFFGGKKEIKGIIKKNFNKNSFLKNNKEKNFVNNFGAHDPMHAFSKRPSTSHLRVIRSLRAICGPSAGHLRVIRSLRAICVPSYL